MADFKNASIIVGTSTTDLYQTPAAKQTVGYGLIITNKHATIARVVSLMVYDDSATLTRTLISNLSIPAEDSYVYTEKINLETLDKVQLVVDTGTDVEAFFNVMEK